MPMSPEEAAAKREARIAALLAKAEKTTPEEAEALTEMAYKLMRQHGIDKDIIAAARLGHDRSTEEIVTVYFPVTGIYAQVQVMGLCSVITASGELKAFTSGRGTNRAVVIVGFKSDVEQCKTLLQSLMLQAVVGLAQYWRNRKDTYEFKYATGMEKYKARRGYMLGFMDGAAERIRSARITVDQEMAQSTSGGSDLVLIKKMDAVEKYVDTKMSIGKGRATRIQIDSGYSDGHSDGRRANTGDTQVTGSRNQIGR